MNHFLPLKHASKGMVTLFTSLVIFLIITIAVLYTAYTVTNQQRLLVNQYNKKQAFNAAEAGLEYASAYFIANTPTVIASIQASPSTAFSPPAFSPGLSNGSTFTVSYSLASGSSVTPINSIVVQVAAMGYSLDSSTSYSMKRQLGVVSGSFSSGSINFPWATQVRGQVNISSNNAVFDNSSGSSTLNSSGLSCSGNNSFQNNKGTQSCKTYSSPNVVVSTSLASQSVSTFFQNIFGQTSTQMKAKAYQNYNNLIINQNKMTVSGTQAGQIIWINGDLNISGNNTIFGSSTAPLIVIATGNINISGNETSFYGFVYAGGDINISGNGNNGKDILLVQGGIAAGGNLNISGNNNQISRSSAILSLLGGGTPSYAPVPGAWKDF